jgi:pectate lyase
MSSVTASPICFLYYLFLLVGLLWCSAAAAATYHVSTGGDDGGPGSVVRPWATIGRAARVMRSGDGVIIRGGVYREAVAIAGSAETGSGPMRFEASPGARVVVDASGHLHGIKVTAPDVILDGLEVTHAERTGIAVYRGGSGAVLRGCVVHDNGRSGIRIARSSGVRVDGCLIYRNGRHGIAVLGRAGAVAINQSTIWGNRRDGIDVSLSQVGVSGCIIAENGAWGIDSHGAAPIGIAYSDLWANATGGIARRAGVMLGVSVLDADPLLQDPQRGDFRLSSGSPAAGSGADGGDMGYRVPDTAPPAEGFVAGVLGGWDLNDPDVLLQTIYGTRQDAAGNVTANTPVALSIDKGLGIAFDVPRDTALDTLRMKLQNAKPEVGIRLRLYDVTYRGFLAGAAPARSAPGGADNVAIFDRSYFTGSTVPSHLEPLASPTAAYSDLIVDLGPLEVLSGEYFLVVDNVGPSNTLGSIMVGDAGEAPDMGERPDGQPLPGATRLATQGSAGNVRYYKLTSTEDPVYTDEPRLPALQLTTTIVNHPPEVDAGDDQVIVLGDTVAHLDGMVSDDGHPAPPATVSATWTLLSGPGTVEFDDPSRARTTATFSNLGVYVLRLTATDSALVASDDVTIKWLAELPPNQLPVVDAGPDQRISLPRAAVLRGRVTDDGEPDPPGSLTTSWSRANGPGTVDFDDPHALGTTASFSVDGTYVLRLTADDGQGSAFDELTVVVTPFGHYEGYGARATGGAGGRVIPVTTLDDGGPGSFRAAVDSLDGTPTIIQFAVGGRIDVGGEIRIARGNVTIMGSSAPAPGITLNGELADRVLGIKASNVIVENLRIRNANLENIVLWGGQDIVIDHCSVTWSGDGALDINGSGYETGVNHVTISRSLFAGAVEVSRSRGHRISWHYNLFTHNNRRQPKIFTAGPDYNFICNYVRHWGNTGINIQDSAQVNIINNFFGPPYPGEQWEQACYTSGTTRAADVYSAGNVHAASLPGGDVRGGYDVNRVGAARAPFAIEVPSVPVTLIPGNEVPANVIADVGALPRDRHDEAFIHSYTGRGRETGGPPP